MGWCERSLGATLIGGLLCGAIISVLRSYLIYLPDFLRISPHTPPMSFIMRPLTASTLPMEIPSAHFGHPLRDAPRRASQGRASGAEWPSFFPLFSRRGRQPARGIRCASNLKQIVTAFKMYVQDNDGLFSVPNIFNSPDDGCGERYEGHYKWLPGLLTVADQLDPYIKSPSIWVCPSDGRDVHPPGSYRTGKHWSSYHYRHYFCIGFHWKCPMEVADWAVGHIPHESRFSNPAGIFCFL